MRFCCVHFGVPLPFEFKKLLIYKMQNYAFVYENAAIVKRETMIMH